MLLDEIIRKSLEEDLGSGDITTRYLDLDPVINTAYMIAKAEGVLAGTGIAIQVFKAVDPELKITLYRKDGDDVHPKDEIMRIEGKPSSILQAERTALNFLQRLSGIASQTRRMVIAMSGTNTKLLDTRKTTPLLRSLEKYAVRVGGGLNHRHGLFDMIMLKENHIRAAGGITKAVTKINAQNASYKVEVEVTNLAELEESVTAKVDRVMLDNMSIKDIKTAVKRYGKKVELEVSGGVNEDNIMQYAKTGVHFISSGSLTHSYKSLDISLLFKE
ncbi:MAG: carboxylating nicotinate-nucleotide diphosphorylase [Candidatus Cloacimonetes bacterium]|jgi:nicotinate-nucleotide pyrophosphorylase (carboxylating)|nr:carboxylating nicotinate-nucleotide diphosphorylase [Candidatus Cloacimonadota bacterium]MCB5279550.1 carboxylating nicotinate-nucleotide diphosphorylase [Candidatus Cloacimonadota bacterium]MDY0299439.1 carboxylating nicotinate-nucleotide diphosphorylase [Candidatus Cloacimonadaceae bacterium]